MPKGSAFCNGKRGDRTHVCTTASVARVERTAKPGAVLPSGKGNPGFRSRSIRATRFPKRMDPRIKSWIKSAGDA